MVQYRIRLFLMRRYDSYQSNAFSRETVFMRVCSIEVSSQYDFSRPASPAPAVAGLSRLSSGAIASDLTSFRKI